MSNNIFAQSDKEINNAEPVGLDSVSLFYDARIDIVAAVKPQTTKSNPYNVVNSNGGYIRSAKGYRIMIYSGTDRAKATAIKSDFMRRYPGVRIYTGYAQPQYRVKIGDYMSRQEAGDLYRKLTQLYSPCMIVPDIIELNTFKKNEATN